MFEENLISLAIFLSFCLSVQNTNVQPWLRGYVFFAKILCFFHIISIFFAKFSHYFCRVHKKFWYYEKIHIFRIKHCKNKGLIKFYMYAFLSLIHVWVQGNPSKKEVQLCYPFIHGYPQMIRLETILQNQFSPFI